MQSKHAQAQRAQGAGSQAATDFRAFGAGSSMGNCFQNHVLRSWKRVAIAAALLFTPLVAAVALFGRDSKADIFMSARGNAASAGVTGPRSAIVMHDKQWCTVLNSQEQYYQEKIRERDDYIKHEKNVDSTQSIWFMYEPLWYCPFGQQLLGAHGDGVKWTCGVPLMALRPSREDYQKLVETKTPVSDALLRESTRVRPPCVVYSAGSNNNVQFEEDVKLRTNCEIHIFDPSKIAPSGWEFGDWNAKYSYHATKVGGTANNETMTFSQLLDKLGNKWVDIFKVDIERAEFGMINAMTPTDFSKIGQILVEIHHPSYTENFDFFSKLEENGFRIFHKEVNVLWPKGAEYALINTAWSPEFGFEDAFDIDEEIKRC